MKCTVMIRRSPPVRTPVGSNFLVRSTSVKVVLEPKIYIRFEVQHKHSNSTSNSNSNVFCKQELVPLKTMFFGTLFQPSTSYKLKIKSTEN